MGKKKKKAEVIYQSESVRFLKTLLCCCSEVIKLVRPESPLIMEII